MCVKIALAVFLIFCFKQNTAYEMRISDWSSDVCSSDLGLIGGHVALHLQSLGHDVTIAARKPAQPGSALAALPIVIGDYVEDGFTREQLAGFDALVFAAGNDIRHLDKNTDEAKHWQRANIDGRSEEHTSELQSIMRISYAVFCLKKKI